MKYEIELTNEQTKIVTHLNTPLRVLAGPGTGKTFCIIQRIRNLINHHKISSQDICSITFTNAAAGELRHRLERSGVKADVLPYINTLHGFAMGILKTHTKRAGLRPGFRPVYGIIKRILNKDVIEDLKQKNIQLSNRDIGKCTYAHSQHKSKAGISKHFQHPLKKKVLDAFTKCYHENLEFYNAVDWVDILHKSIELIGCYDDIKKEVHSKTKYLLVDEYQDLSPLEQEFVDKICGDSSGLCIVGDDDQCIYETFRFAAPQGIIDFPSKYTNARMLYLTLCRRCPPVVIEKALKLIANNKVRVKEKELVPFDKNKKGFAVILRRKSKKSEIEWLVSKVKELTQEKYEHRDIIVLFTDGKIAKDYVIALKKAGIPLEIQLKVSNMFASEYFIWLIATIRWLVDTNDNLSLRQCLDYAKGIGTETIRQLRLLAISSNSNLWDAIETVASNPRAFKTMRQRRRVKEFRNYLNTLQNTDSFSRIVENFYAYIPDSKEDKGCRLLYEHFKAFDLQKDAVNLQDVLEDFEHGIDSGNLESKSDQERKAVRVMTMHSAKGCESPIVFLPALEEDIVPGTSDNIEEKRRLFYVSLTRAKVGAYLTWASQRTGQEIHMHNRRMLDKKRSRFLDEIEQ